MSVMVALSVDGLTTRAAWIAGLGVLALLLTGWRKTVRAQPRGQRHADTTAHVPIEVLHEPAQAYRRPGPIRRLLALGGSGVIAVVTGAVVAIVLAFGVSWAVTTATSLLKQ